MIKGVYARELYSIAYRKLQSFKIYSLTQFIFRSDWKTRFPKRDLEAFSAEPLLIYPARYLHEEGYTSDTEDSAPVNVVPREDL